MRSAGELTRCLVSAARCAPCRCTPLATVSCTAAPVTCVFMFSGVGIIGAALGVVANIIIDKQRELEAAADQFLEGITQKKHSDGAEDCMTRTKWSLLFSGAAIVLMLSIGTTVMVFAEDYSFVDALYFSCVVSERFVHGMLLHALPRSRPQPGCCSVKADTVATPPCRLRHGPFSPRRRLQLSGMATSRR